MEKICDYGCGQKATHQFANGKWIALRLYEKSPHIDLDPQPSVY